MRKRKLGKRIIMSGKEIENKYGYTREHYILDELYYNSTLNKEERLDLFRELSPETIKRIPDEDILEFGLTKEEIQKIMESNLEGRMNNGDE